MFLDIKKERYKNHAINYQTDTDCTFVHRSISKTTLEKCVTNCD